MLLLLLPLAASARGDEGDPAPPTEPDAAAHTAAEAKQGAGDDATADEDAADGGVGEGVDLDEATTPRAGASLDEAISDIIATSVHGELTTRYRARWTNGRLGMRSDHDLYEYLALRVGDEYTDEWSATFLARGTADLDHSHGDDQDGYYTFDSLNDSYDSRVNGKLYTGYITYRPESGPLETARLGRQYIDAGQTFHVDGLRLISRPLDRDLDLRVSVYGGVPVHLYESSPRGDSIGGLSVELEPIDGTRIEADYAHVEDDLSVFGDQNNDWASLSIWHDLSRNLELHGQATYLEDELRDVTARATVRYPDEDLLFQLRYYRLLEEKNEFATEFDPYFSVLHTLERYHIGTVRAVKGFGEDFVVEAGASVRDLVPGAEESAFNRDVHRYYVTPTWSDALWADGWITGTAEVWSGGGTRTKTFGGEIGHRVGKQFKFSAGTDYSLFGFGPLGDDERNHIRSYYARLRLPLTDTVTLDARQSWEQDDVERIRVFQITITVAF